MAIFTFLLKSYNYDEDTYQEIGTILEATRRGRGYLSWDALHRIFYQQFMLGYCTR